MSESESDNDKQRLAMASLNLNLVEGEKKGKQLCLMDRWMDCPRLRLILAAEPPNLETTLLEHKQAQAFLNSSSLLLNHPSFPSLPHKHIIYINRSPAIPACRVSRLQLASW